VEDFVNGSVGRQRAVEDVELAFQPLWNVVAPAAWMNHRAHHLYVHDARKFARLFQVVKAMCFHHLSGYLICHLQTNQALI